MQYFYPLKNLLNVNLRRLTLFISFIILGLITLKPTATFAQEPTITSFTPTTGSAGTLVSITGTNLSNPTAITIGEVSAISISNDGTTLVVMQGATTGGISVTTAGEVQHKIYIS